jgi:RND family efflux transporter MFP subunit
MKQFAVTILIVSLVMLFGGCSKNGNKTLELEKKAINVKVEKIRLGEFSKFLRYKGSVSPWKRANIAPDSSGKIWKIFKKQGDMVKKDTLLAELDTTTMKLQLNQAQAAFEVAKAAFNDAKLNLERMKKLSESNAISQMQLEKAQLAYESADTQMKNAAANLDVVKHTLDNSYMKAPFDGIITSKNMEEGDMINPMMGMGASVLTLMDLNKVKIILDVPGEYIEKIQIDQPCWVTINSLEGKKFSGTVYSKNLAADPVSKTFKVEIKIDNPEILIKAGVFAEVMIEIFRQSNVMTLPLSALIDDQRVVVYDNGLAKNLEVKVGERNENECIVLDGLPIGQLVVVEGNYDLKDGSPITIEGAIQ